MKLFKKHLSILLVATIIMGIFAIMPMSVFATDTNPFIVVNTSQDTVKITGYNGTDTVVDIPSEINSKKVTRIDNNAFFSCQTIVTLTIPETVTSIGNSAFFRCLKLTEINLPSGIMQIEPNAFSQTAYYNNIENWENNVLYIDKYLISGDGLSAKVSGDYTVKDNTVLVADSAFNGCNNLKSISIPATVNYIGTSVFSSCTSLENISIDENNQSYIFENGALFNKAKTQLMKYLSASENTSYTLPETVEIIEKYAFKDSGNLENVYLSQNLKSIQQKAFNNCDNLKEIIIPDSVTFMGEDVFRNCDNLSSVTIGSGLLTINKCAFLDCINLQTIKLSESVSYIGVYAFSGSEKLEEIEIPKSVLNIGGHAFANSTSLKKAVIPAEVVIIDNYAFDGCENLTIYGYKDTVAESFANTNNLPFVQITDEETSSTTEPTESTVDTTPSESVSDSTSTEPTESTSETTPSESVEPTESTVDTTPSESVSDSTSTEPTESTSETTPSESVEPTESTSETTPSSETEPSEITPTQHIHEKVTTSKNATYFENGYKNKVTCKTCKIVISKGTTVKKLTLKVPKVSYTGGKKKLTVKYKKVTSATGFQVKYKVGKKTVTKTFNTKKSINKVIKKLKKGTYKVQVRAFVKSGSKIAYSKWTKAKKVKVK